MHIAVQCDLALPVRVPDQLLRMVDRWVQEPVWCQPLTVEVTPQQGASVVTVDDTIRVQHRHHLEDKVFP